ncbi:MAG: endonuclease III [archaeon GBS-70-058]|nr:endonuclease III [Candidatus Culexarchaeum nevadense]
MTFFDPKSFLKMLSDGVKLDYESYAVIIAHRSSDPFKLLIMTILSQNTNDKNAIKAYNNISSKFNVDAKTLSSIPLETLSELIKPAGMYIKRAARIIEVSKIIYERYNGDMNIILNLPCDEARNTLMLLPGVGAKTADVILLFTGKCPTFPVDTHIARVSKRLGIVSANASYEDIRSAWMKMYEASDYLRLHLLLIALGRQFCTARNPKHDVCPVKVMCGFWRSITS